MRRRARIFAGLCLAVLLCLPSGCSAAQPADKPVVYATLFPLYDFVRQIAGERVQAEMLLPPGAESHAYEPAPTDIARINRADLFVYTGAYMEPWAERILAGTGGVAVVDASEGIALEEPDAHGHAEADADADAHAHADAPYDPHIWTDPINAKRMVDNICAGLCASDAENAAFYRANADAYKERLDQLDAAFAQVVSEGTRQEVFFGGRFAFHYFIHRYGLEYTGAYDSCASESEPSARRLAELITQIREKDIPVLYYEELSEPKVAQSIADQTGVRLLLLHSAHNVTKDDFQGGVTYLDLMWQNVENLREGLQ